MTDHDSPNAPRGQPAGTQTFAIAALFQLAPGSRTAVSTVKLARGWGDAAAELQRMIDVTVESLGPAHGRAYTIDRGHGWAHVEFSDGIVCHFSIQKTSWAKKGEEAKV